MIKKGTKVQIQKQILSADERSFHIPDDTKKTPFMMWIKGYLLEDAAMHQPCRIQTKTGRIEQGILVDVKPHYAHSFGTYVHVLDDVSRQIECDMEKKR